MVQWSEDAESEMHEQDTSSSNTAKGSFPRGRGGGKGRFEQSYTESAARTHH